MGKYSSQDIRNVALVGHANSGKTTLADTILKVAGVVKRTGSVADGSSISDFDDEERERKNSIYTALIRAPWHGKQLHILDTPGYPDYIGETITSMAAADLALICVSAVNGVGLNTRRTWDIAGKYGTPRAFLITKLDADGADYDKSLAQIREIFGKNCVPVMSPDGVGASFKGVVNLLAADGPGRRELVEAIAETDDALMEKYLGDEQLADAELAPAFASALAAGKLVPVLCCAAAKELGVTELLDIIAAFFPAPAARAALALHKPGKPDEPAALPALDGPLAAFVFKIQTDPFVGKIAYFRVVTGKLDPQGFTNARTGSHPRINALLLPQGKDQDQTDLLVAGDIGAVAKIDDIALGDTLAPDDESLQFGPFPLPVPMVSLAVFPKSRGDEGRISTSLQRLVEEDPTFRFERDRQTKELVVRGMSALHLDVILSRLKRRFNVEVETKVPEVPYLETVTAYAESHYRHKKQTGGRGQFGEVYMKVEPNERGKGLEFVDEIFGGSIPKNFLPAIEKGVRETMEKGVIAGHEVVDVRARVYDGSFHAVDSDEISFKIAGARAFAEGVAAARPVLLEPIVTFEITVPSRFMGDVTGDLSGRRGRISDTGVVGDMQLISGEIPLAEVQTYSTELRSMTGGEGSYTIAFSRYDVVPARLLQDVINRAKARQEEDKK